MDETSSCESVLDAWKAEQYVLTIERAQRHLRQFADDWMILSLLGQASHQIGRPSEAKSVLERALALAPRDKQYMVHRELGDVCRWSGQFPEAEQHYRYLIDERPDHAEGYVFLGAMFAALGRLDAAEEMHRRGILCSEGAVDEAYFNLALVLRARGAYSGARDSLQRALEIDPDYPEAVRALGDLEAAIADAVDA